MGIILKTKILDLKSSSEQIFSKNWRWVPLKNRLLFPLEPLNNVAEKTDTSECTTRGIHKKEHSGAKPPPKGLIKAKFTSFLHFFSFLDQIDYDCWPNDIKFLFDAKC